jgi:hypothetical protein
MVNRKKVTALVLSALLLGQVAAVSGCGTGGAGAESSADPAESSTAEVADFSAADASSAESAGEVQEQRFDHPRLIPLGKKTTYFDAEKISDSVWLSGSCDELIPSDPGMAGRYPGLASALLSAGRGMRERAEQNFQELGDAAERLDPDDLEDIGGFSATGNIFIFRTDTNTVSVQQHMQRRGNDDSQFDTADTKIGVNLDPETGNDLVLRDFVADLDSFRGLYREKAAEALGLDPGDEQLAAEADRLIGDGNVPSSEEFSFAAGHEGLYFYLNTGKAFAFAGRGETSIPFFLAFSDNPGVYTDRAKMTTDRWVQELDCTLSGAGPESAHGSFVSKRRISELSLGYQLDEYGEIYAPDLRIDGQSHGLEKIEELGYDRLDAAVARAAEGKSILCLTLHGPNDYCIFQTYDISQAGAFLGKEDGTPEGGGDGSPAFTDPENFRLNSISQLLGTAAVFRNYRLDPSGGKPEAKEENYTYTEDNDALTVKKPLTGEIVRAQNAQGSVSYAGTGETVDIPVGETVVRRATDGRSRVILELEDGSLAAVEVDTGDGWPITIGGVNVEEMFDGIYFAG